MFSIQFAVEPEVKIVRGIRSSRNRSHKPSSSLSQEEIIIPKPCKHSNQYPAVSFKTIDFIALKILMMLLM